MSRLRVIRDGARDGPFNMEADRRLLAAQRPDGSPVLRLYRWSPPAVSFGYHQRLTDFDQAAIRDAGFDLVQRPTGGRAILHADELTYAVVGSSPSDLFGPTLHTSYQTINRALLIFLRWLGIAADVSAGESRAAQRSAVCFRSAGRHEIRVAGRKLIGSAQRRNEAVFLQHGSILTGPGHADLVRLLAHNKASTLQGTGAGECPPTAARERLLAATTDLGRLLARPVDSTLYEELETQLVDAFAAAWSLDPEVVPPGE
ncbi:MAG: biotin/lipoate A/B protein ligase family protein [bacterium]